MAAAAADCTCVSSSVPVAKMFNKDCALLESIEKARLKDWEHSFDVETQFTQQASTPVRVPGIQQLVLSVSEPAIPS